MNRNLIDKVCRITFKNQEGKNSIVVGLITDYTDRIFYLRLQSPYFHQHTQMNSYKTIQTTYISPTIEIQKVEEIEDYKTLAYKGPEIIKAIFEEDLKTP